MQQIDLALLATQLLIFGGKLLLLLLQPTAERTAITRSFAGKTTPVGGKTVGTCIASSIACPRLAWLREVEYPWDLRMPRLAGDTFFSVGPVFGRPRVHDSGDQARRSCCASTEGCIGRHPKDAAPWRRSETLSAERDAGKPNGGTGNAAGAEACLTGVTILILAHLPTKTLALSPLASHACWITFGRRKRDKSPLIFGQEAVPADKPKRAHG